MAIGDGAELFVTGNVGVRVDDNIFLDQSKTDDVIFDIAPGAELTFGKNAQLKGALTLSLAFANYADNSNLNTQLFGSNFRSDYDDGKVKLGFNAGYNELNQNAPDIRGLTRRNVFSAAANAELEVSQLTSVSTGISYGHEFYHRTNYTGSDTYTVPVHGYYHMTPKLDLSAGYTYNTTNLQRLGNDLSSHFYSVGARGDFTPKLKGTFNVGLSRRRVAGGKDDSTLGLDTSVSWEATPKTNVQFGATNGFSASPTGQQQRNLTVNGLATTRLTEEWMLNTGLSWRAINYGTRTDDYWEGQLGTSYIINANVNVGASYVHRQYTSDLTTSEFKNNVFSISANLRY